MNTARLLFLAALLTFAGACGRDSARQGITIVVVDEARVDDPFGPSKIERRSAEGARVFLFEEGNSPTDLTQTTHALRECSANAEGRCWFGAVEGLFDVAVDLNDDDVVDGMVFNVESGTTRRIVIDSLATLGEPELTLSLSDEVYHQGVTAPYQLTGFLPREVDVTVEIWHEATDRKRVSSAKAGSLSNHVEAHGHFEVGQNWTPTPPNVMADYLAIPKVKDSYYTGARFTVKVSPLPIDGMSLVINGGAAITGDPNVALTLTANRASTMTIAEDPAQLLTALRFAYMPNAGWRLTGADGTKTLWAMFFDADGNDAGPVSDSIVLDAVGPPRPDTSRFVVMSNPPGSDDYLSGLPGAVEGGSFVRVYADSLLATMITSGYALADGSFGPLNIGNNQVLKPFDFVLVTATDTASRQSDPAPAYNDSTAPDLWPEHFSLSWEADSLMPGVGNPGDVFRVIYSVPVTYAPATDVTGGWVDLRSFGGPATAPLLPYGPSQYSALFTIPTGISVDNDFIRYRVRVHDAAMNVSPWVFSADYYSVDSIPPSPPTLTKVVGGNRELGARWSDFAFDSIGYEIEITDSVGGTYSFLIDKADYYTVISEIPNPISPNFPGMYPFTGLPNCHWYTVRVRSYDNGGNASTYSSKISDYVVLPPPGFEAWAGLSGNSGLIAYSVGSVTNATSYELHFDTDSGPAYTYDNGSVTSPVAVAVPDGMIRLQYLVDLPLRTTFYLAARARDDLSGLCVSAFGQEMTATTDLREAAHFDGSELDTIGGALALTKDYNGDGIVDFLSGAPYPQYASIVSGGNASELAQLGIYRAPDSYDVPGLPVAAANVDGDAEDEFLVGAPLESPNGVLVAGVARLYDHDGSLLQTYEGDAEGLHYGFTIVRLGDLSTIPDGIDEFAIAGFGCLHRSCGVDSASETPTEGPGKLIVYDGATRMPKYPALVGPSVGDYFGIAVTVVSDVDFDGVPELVIGAPGTERGTPSPSIYVHSGRTGSQLASIAVTSAVGLRAGAALARLTGVPGYPELIVIGAPGATPGTPGEVYAVTPQGDVVWWHSGLYLFGGSGFGAVLATGGDVNGDGVPDVVVGAPLGAQSLFYGAGVAFVLDGATGRTLYEIRGTGNDGTVGYSALSPGNLVLGGRDEWVVGAPGSGHNGYQSGRIYILTTDP